MSRKTISRRDALGVIGKTGAALGAGTYFFLSLKTSPLAGASAKAPGEGIEEPQTQRRGLAKRSVEKVVVSGSGSTLIFKISGPAGRHCGVSFATTDGREHYKVVASGRGVIGKDGLCTIEVDAKRLPDAKIYLRVVTGNTSAFDDDIAGTEPFVIHISQGAITRFEGLQSRPLENAGASGIAVASCAAACFTAKR